MFANKHLIVNSVSSAYFKEQKVAKSSAKIIDTEDIPFSSTVTFSCPLNSTSSCAAAPPAILNTTSSAAVDLGVNGHDVTGFVISNSFLDFFLNLILMDFFTCKKSVNMEENVIVFEKYWH